MVFPAGGVDDGATAGSGGASAQRSAAIPVVSSPFTVSLKTANFMGDSQVPSRHGQTTNPGSLASEVMSGSQDTVTVWWYVTAAGDNLQVSSGQSTHWVDVTVSGPGALGRLPASVVLDCGADVSRILVPVLSPS